MSTKKKKKVLKSIKKPLWISRVQILERKDTEATARNWVILQMRFIILKMWFPVFVFFFTILYS